MTTLGVVLGGGGARGLAHIGVLRALADVDLLPEVVVGVSMGAVVGATYAAREDWYEALRSFDRSHLPGHEPLTEAEGVDFIRAVIRSAVDLAPKVVNFGMAGGYETFGRETMAELLGGELTFADLRIPLAVTATDIIGGRRAVLRHGDVTEAVMASAALPVLTKPLPGEAASYLDGGFADPAPVDVARGLGADVVMMVHVGAPPTPDPDQASDGSPLSGVLRGLEIGIQAFVDTRLAAADLVVAPDFPSGVSWMAFNRADELAAVGHEAMRAKIPALTELLGG